MAPKTPAALATLFNKQNHMLLLLLLRERVRLYAAFPASGMSARGKAIRGIGIRWLKWVCCNERSAEGAWKGHDLDQVLFGQSRAAMSVLLRALGKPDTRVDLTGVTHAAMSVLLRALGKMTCMAAIFVPLAMLQ